LKNLVEQISVLEINREINTEKLLKYLPSESNYLPALYKSQSEDPKSGISERELLYKVLFDMRKDVNELKKLVHGMIKDEYVDQNGVEKTSEIFRNFPDPDLSGDTSQSPFVIDSSDIDYDFDSVEDISHETERDESLSIEAKEKELIIKALRKNNNKRKYAARDLGISERTLYRKIKQFEIDD
jgi:DNA-binding NtrC family response regulator